MSRKLKWSEKKFQSEENEISLKIQKKPKPKYFNITTSHKCTELLDDGASLAGLIKPGQVWKKQFGLFEECTYKLKWRNNFFAICDSYEIVEEKMKELSSLLNKKKKRVR